jgi:para-aminobenzoate synthetase component 1
MMHAYPTDQETFIRYLLYYAQENYSYVAYYTDNDYTNYPLGGFDHVLALGNKREVQFQEKVDWNELESFWQKHNAFTCGYISYDAYENWYPELVTDRPRLLPEMPIASWWLPEVVIYFRKDGYSTSMDISFILVGLDTFISNNNTASVTEEGPHAWVDQDQYIHQVHQIQRWLKRGNIYELNYCIPFSGKAEIHPVEYYLKLNELSPMPFSGWLKADNYMIFSASPERFLKQDYSFIISQPIKGTAKRSSDSDLDEKQKQSLIESEKERAENSMIVDLVRHDLSQIAIDGTVKVKELYGVYTFPTVHQMISTVSAEMDVTKTGLTEVMYATFPMGSMTGAPKYNALKYISEIEPFKRGAFSGTMGYKLHQHHFDGNVLIRSLFYDANNKNYYFEAGSAITVYANAEQEYEECLLKASVLKTMLQS